ncbi:MAG: AraC family transcriptional regulator [Bacteroidota bacterium]
MELALPIPDLLAVLVGGGAVVLGVIVGGLLLAGRGAYPVARRFLGGFLLAAALSLSNELIYSLSLQRLSAHFWINPLVYTLSLGPLVYLFIRHRLAPRRPLGRRDLWHAVLPAVQAVHEWVTGFGTLALKSAYWQSTFGQTYTMIETPFFVVSFALYLWASSRMLGAHEGDDPDAQRWLQRLVRGCVVIVVVVGVMETSFLTPSLEGAVGERAFAWLRLGEMVAYASMLYWVAFTGFVQTLPRRERLAPRAETYGLSEDDIAGHVVQIRRLMTAERLYLDPELTLRTLADRLGLSDKQVSYVLNEGMESSYTDYVNGLRVAEAERLLADPDRTDDSVLQLGMEAGFASKATFNRVFKRATGRTPSQFRATSPRLRTS